MHSNKYDNIFCLLFYPRSNLTFDPGLIHSYTGCNKITPWSKKITKTGLKPSTGPWSRIPYTV